MVQVNKNRVPGINQTSAQICQPRGYAAYIINSTVVSDGNPHFLEFMYFERTLPSSFLTKRNLSL
jgi:hypothetical protein